MLKLQLNPGSCRTYVLACERTGQAILVDPVVDRVEADLATIAGRGLRVVRIVDTHTHADHVSAGTLLKEKLQVPYAMHQRSPVRSADQRLKDGDVLGFGDEQVLVLHTPGHTKDSLSLLGGGVLLTGDFLFLGEGGAGRTDLLGGDPGEHWDSLQKLATVADETLVLPGHDYRGGTSAKLGEERKRNPRLAARTREDYVHWLTALRLEPAEWMIDVIKANAAGATSTAGLRIPTEGACCEVRGGGAPPSPGGRIVPPAELAARLAETPRPYVVVDVREPFEFSGPLGRVPGARNVSVQELERRIGELQDARDRELYVICLAGGRSARAADLLRRHGFKGVIDVAGGMKAWTAAGLPQEFDS